MYKKTSFIPLFQLREQLHTFLDIYEYNIETISKYLTPWLAYEIMEEKIASISYIEMYLFSLIPDEIHKIEGLPPLQCFWLDTYPLSQNFNKNTLIEVLINFELQLQKFCEQHMFSFLISDDCCSIVLKLITVSDKRIQQLK